MYDFVAAGPDHQIACHGGATGANARKSHGLTGIGGHAYRDDSFRILCRADLHLEELHALPPDNFLRSTRRSIIACTSPNLPATNEMYPTTEAWISCPDHDACSCILKSWTKVSTRRRV